MNCQGCDLIKEFKENGEGRINKCIDINVDVIGHDGICSAMQEDNQRKLSIPLRKWGMFAKLKE